jgi:two-component system NtrC family sensor kinase
VTLGAIDVLASLAACAASDSRTECLPAALTQLAHAAGAARCSVSVDRNGEPVVVASSDTAARAPHDAHVTRIQMHAGDRTVGTLVANFTKPVEDSSRQLLDVAASVLAAALPGADHASKDHLTQQILDSLPLGLHVVDRDYRIRAWNRTRESGLQGVQRDDALGRSIFEVLRRQPEDVLRREFDSVFETGEILRFDIQSGAGGASRVYRVSKIPMREGGAEVTHVITIGEDVTDATRAQEEAAQARKLAAVGTLAAGAMHEINNPLATIGACAETLALQLADPAMPESLRETFVELCDIIDHEVHRSKRILNGLLDFSRPTGATRAPAELRSIFEQTLRLLKYHTHFRAMHVHIEIATEAPLLVRADRDQLVQVLMALLLNAMDAMNQSGTIRLRAFRAPARGEEVVMEVIDAGSGIPAAVRQRLFEPFFTTKPPGRGTGLGLSICYGIVADHGGRIEVESAVGKGSTFRVTLPLAESGS